MSLNLPIPIGDNSEDIKFFVETEVERQTELKRLLKGGAYQNSDRGGSRKVSYSYPLLRPIFRRNLTEKVLLGLPSA